MISSRAWLVKEWAGTWTKKRKSELVMTAGRLSRFLLLIWKHDQQWWCTSACSTGTFAARTSSRSSRSLLILKHVAATTYWTYIEWAAAVQCAVGTLWRIAQTCLPWLQVWISVSCWNDTYHQRYRFATHTHDKLPCCRNSTDCWQMSSACMLSRFMLYLF